MLSLRKIPLVVVLNVAGSSSGGVLVENSVIKVGFSLVLMCKYILQFVGGWQPIEGIYHNLFHLTTWNQR